MEDAELVVRARSGDPGAFEELVARHHGACLRYAGHLLGDRMEAEDVVQDTWVRAYRSLDRYQERRQFRSWLFRILVNRCQTRFGRRSRWQTVEPEETLADPRSSPIELPSRLTRSLSTLDGPHREAFLLKFGEGLPYDEIARLTGASVPALKMRVKRARDQVRAQWKEHELDGR